MQKNQRQKGSEEAALLAQPKKGPKAKEQQRFLGAMKGKEKSLQERVTDPVHSAIRAQGTPFCTCDPQSHDEFV